jgi:FkbM family methyltransferase
MKRLFPFGIFFLMTTTALLGSSETYSSIDANGVPFDHKLQDRFKKQNGFFIEVGAYDGLTQSNTYLLEKNLGWRGVLIEPSPSEFIKLLSNRPNSFCFECALGSLAENGAFVWGDFDHGPMSSIGGKRIDRSPNVRVLMRSLQSILDEIGVTHVDFFSLDTEGYEYNILQGIDYEKVVIDYMLIEIYSWDLEKITSFLSAKGFELVECFSFYSHATCPEWDGTHNDYLFRRKDTGS